MRQNLMQTFDDIIFSTFGMQPEKKKDHQMGLKTKRFDIQQGVAMSILSRKIKTPKAMLPC